MKAKFSPLQLLDFKLLESDFEFLAPESSDIDHKKLFFSYPVEIDFDINSTEDNKEIQLITRIKVNADEEYKLRGYKILVEGGGTFSINESEKMDEGLKTNLLKFSPLNMMINNLRNIMYQITNLGPLGGYLLPPIDISKLLQDKIEEQEAN